MGSVTKIEGMDRRFGGRFCGGDLEEGGGSYGGDLRGACHR